MQNRQYSLTLMLRGVLGKTAESALPAAPSVPNPAPKPLKTPSFTTRPPSTGKAMADVRPGLSAQVTSRTQSLGTAKAQAPRQTSVTKAVTTPREFRAAAPAVPMPKIAQLLNPAYGAANASTGRTVPGMSVRATVPGRVSAPVARPVPQAIPQAPDKPVPENPHYEARDAVHEKRLKAARKADVRAWAKAHPEHVVPLKTDEEIAQRESGYRGVGERIGNWLKRYFGDGSYVPDYVHDFANTMEITANGLQKGIDFTLSKGIKWVDPRSWGSSFSAKANRLSHDNDWENARRAYDARHEKLVNSMRMGDSNDPRVRTTYAVPRAVGEFFGATLATGGVGNVLKGVGTGVTAVGRAVGSGAGKAIAAGAQRVGMSAARAGRVGDFVKGLGTDIGGMAAAPARYAGNALVIPMRVTGAAVNAVRHPVQAARAVANGARTAARVVAHPVQNAKAVWKWRPISHGLDAYMYGQNAYDVGRGALEGDFGRAAGSAADTGWYTAMRRLNPRFGIPLAIAPAVAQTAYALGTSNPEE